LADFYVGQGDLPLWSETLTDGDGNPVLIQGASLVMSMVPIRTGADVITAGGVVVNDDDGTVPNRGKVHRQMLAGETAAAGDYLVRVVATQASKPITFPNTGYFLWTVTPTGVGQQRRYLGVEEFKESAYLAGITSVDRDIDRALEAASRGLEAAYGATWTLGTPGQQRYYTGYNNRAKLGDVIAVTAVDVDFGRGTYGTTLVSSEYRLLPIESGLAAAGGNGEPYQTIHLSRSSSIRYLGFPGGLDGIRITGTFGWETVPAGVRTATAIIASRLLRRGRDAPFGIASFGADGAAIRAGQIATDPEVTFAMEAVRRKRVMVV
jgi:hypothetical protein